MTLRRRLVHLMRSLRLDRPIDAVAGSLVSMDTENPVFHLTYDDGPHPVTTPRVLDALDEHGAKATFFVLTQQAEAHSDILGEVIRRGHRIGLHTRSHPRLTELDRGGLIDEIRSAHSELEHLAQCEIEWFRPPYGAQNLRSLAVVRSSGMRTLLWSVDSRDWKGLDTVDPLSGATADLTPGGILLMHDTPVGDNESDDLANGYIPKAELTRRYLDELDRLGLEAVSLDELLSSGRRHRRAKLG